MELCQLGRPDVQRQLRLCAGRRQQARIWRQIRLESFRDVSAGVLRVVATLRFDAKFAEEPGVAKLINIQL